MVLKKKQDRVYTLIGFIPNSPIGLVSPTEMFLFSFIYGGNVGSMQSYARTIYAELIPVGRETEFFSIYEITAKGSSFLGPLIVAIVSNTSTMRWAMFYILC